MKKPCTQCPYKKDSIRGYLGDSSGQPEAFLIQLEFPKIHPCHITVSDEEWDKVEQMDKPVCIGSLQFMNNQLKKSRFKEVSLLQDAVGKNPDVFNNRLEFIEHHGKITVGK